MIHQSQPLKFYDIFRPKIVLHKVNRCESARAVSGRRCPQSGVGEDFLTRRPEFFCENNRNSETKSRKIVPKVQSEPFLRGLPTGCYKN